MNKQISQIGLVALILMIALIVGTTYWQTWAAAGLAARQDNAIQRVAQFQIKRGLIEGRGGHPLLAANVRQKIRGNTYYFRRYPSRGLVAQTVGYSTQGKSQTGLEKSENDYLTGANANLDTVLRTALDRIKGVTITGNDLTLTVRGRAQRIALDALGTQCGAVVALEPSTGKVLVIASTPTYNPNLVEHHFARIARIRAQCSPASPLLNRATAGLYTPGSSFKVVTAAAALDTGKYTLESTFYDPGYCIEYGKRVYNFRDQSGPETFGTLDFLTALQHSVNAVFCKIGKRLGAGTILEYAKRFGFYDKPPLETPANERAASGLYAHGRLFRPKHDYQVDPGRLAFGQERMLVTPLQMAMHRRRSEHDDARSRHRRDGDRGPDSRSRGGRQDGHGRDRKLGDQHHLVHRLRPRRSPAGRGRRRPPEPDRVRRDDGRSHRKNSDGGPPVELLTCMRGTI